jgi:acetylornithine/N-succinyldiaminopimelate aminotransferase
MGSHSLEKGAEGARFLETNVTSSLLPTYARAELAFARGEGVWLTSTKGERFLDFGAGIAVASLGHAHPALVAALTQQGQKLWHTSNVFEIPEAEHLARQLTAATFADLVFFTNSGAEAIEGSLKTARKYQSVSGHPERFEIVTCEGAFHGRTLATIAAGGNPKYLDGFGPKVEGFVHIPMNDIAALKAAIGPQTAAIMVEPIQGEGGVRVADRIFLETMRKLCDEHGLLLIFDEVQCGFGRVGKLFAYQYFGVVPDILATAKGLGGGFPLGAFLVTKEAGKGMVAGTHGTTYGGNPLATTVGSAVLDIVLAPGFLERVDAMGQLLAHRLTELKDVHPGIIAEVRGIGLMLGLAVRVPIGDFVLAARQEKILVIQAAENVARILPPLIIGVEEIDEAIRRLDLACLCLEAKLGGIEQQAAQ